MFIWAQNIIPNNIWEFHLANILEPYGIPEKHLNYYPKLNPGMMIEKEGVEVSSPKKRRMTKGNVGRPKKVTKLDKSQTTLEKFFK